jgi:hypothetical protein
MGERYLTMRILLALVVVVVFAALWVIDTAALAHLTMFCVTGGCGVRPVWIAIVGAALAFAAVLSLRRSHGKAGAARIKKIGPARVRRGKSAASQKPKAGKKRLRPSH